MRCTGFAPGLRAKQKGISKGRAARCFAAWRACRTLGEKMPTIGGGTQGIMKDLAGRHWNFD